MSAERPAEDHVKALLNLLEDFDQERARLRDTERAILNVLEDASGEKERLEETQRAILNLLEDFDAERNRAEAAGQNLARSNAELEQFAYVASHDLQEPLRMVSSFTQLLDQRYHDRLDDKARKYIFYAVDGATRMQRLITDLLAYSRVGTRGQRVVRTDARTALDEAVRNLAGAIAESGARVTRADLPEVLADAPQLVQLFQNLVGNAIKFRGSEPPRIHVSAARQDDRWVFRVQDNGIGIESQHFDRIFVVFQRLHSREEYPGTGIGLALCKRIVERHGGRLWVESEVGRGSSFLFTLRAVERPGHAPAARST